MIAAALSAVLFAVGWLGFESLRPETIKGIGGGGIPTPYLRLLPARPPLGTAVLVHGLSSNKEFMQTLAMALCDAGYEVYAIDLPGHGDSSVAFTYYESLSAIRMFLEELDSDPIVVGHSLGGALLAELASTRRFRAVVLISPPPTPLESFLETRVLALSGGRDAPGVNDFMPELVDAGGPEVRWWMSPDAAHSTTLFDPRSLQLIADWIRSPESDRLRTLGRMGWLGLMASAGLALPIFLAPSGPRRLVPSETLLTSELVRWVAALVVAVVTLRFVSPFGWMGLFATDYLIGLLFLMGLLLWKGRPRGVTLPGVAVGVAGAAYVAIVLLSTVGLELMHLVPSGAQWFRFPVFVAAGLPLALYDEQVLRPVRPWWKRWAMFTLTRALLWAGVVTGTLILSPESSFLVIVMHFFAVGWIVLWSAAGFIARRTGEPAAAALFGTLVQGWVFAAVFVRI